MAFTRGNLGTTTTFTRDGSTTSFTTPNFQVFEVVKGNNTFSLGEGWTLQTSPGNNPSLKFYYGSESILHLSNTGVQNLTLGKLSLQNKSLPPNTLGYSEGDLIKADGELYVLIGSEQEQNEPD